MTENRPVVDALDGKLPPVPGNASQGRKEEDMDMAQEEDVKTSDVEKVQSASRKSVIDPSTEPPDGGLHAWLKVFGCFLLYSNIWYVPACF
jgi:hypothetical protein